MAVEGGEPRLPKRGIPQPGLKGLHHGAHQGRNHLLFLALIRRQLQQLGHRRVGAIHIEMVGREGMAGVGHHRAASIGEGLNRDPGQPPALLGGGIEIQQPKGQGQPGLHPGGGQHKQPIGAGLHPDAGNGGEGMVELPIRQGGGCRLQGHLRPTKHRLAAGMGQQGAAEHQPIGLAQQVSLLVQQLPGALGRFVEVAHQGAEMGVHGGGAQRRAGALGQLEQAPAELVHPAFAAEQLAAGVAIGFA